MGGSTVLIEPSTSPPLQRKPGAASLGALTARTALTGDQAAVHAPNATTSMPGMSAHAGEGPRGSDALYTKLQGERSGVSVGHTVHAQLPPSSTHPHSSSAGQLEGKQEGGLNPQPERLDV